MRSIRSTPVLFAPLCAVLALSASCGYFDAPTGVNAPAIALGIVPSADSVAQGDSLTVTTTVIRTNGYTGNIAISVTGAPPGVTSTIINSSPATDTATSIVTLTVAATTDTGTYTLSVRATGSGSTDTTAIATFPLTVTSAVPPSYTMLTGAGALSIAEGGNSNTVVIIGRTNFAGTIALTAENLPTGVTAAFVPASLRSSSSVLTISVAAAAPPGNYTVTLRGTAAGLADVITTLGLTVNAATLSSWTTTLSASTDSLAPGATGSTTLTFVRSNFTGAINLEAENLPDGVTASFAPNPAPAGSSILMLAIDPTTTPGTYNLTLRGSVTGLTDVTSSLTLVVTASGGVRESLRRH